MAFIKKCWFNSYIVWGHATSSSSHEFNDTMTQTNLLATVHPDFSPEAAPVETVQITVDPDYTDGCPRTRLIW